MDRGLHPAPGGFEISARSAAVSAAAGSTFQSGGVRSKANTPVIRAADGTAALRLLFALNGVSVKFLTVQILQKSSCKASKV